MNQAEVLQNMLPVIPRKRILSDRVQIHVKNPYDMKIIKIGEFDQFSAQKNDTVRKFKPCGNTSEIALIEEHGWDLSFSGGKVDYKLARLVHTQEVLVNNNINGELNRLIAPTSSMLSHASLVAPKFLVSQTITYYDGSFETYNYPGTTLFGYSMNVDANLEEVKESIKGFAPIKVLDDSNTLFVDEITMGKKTRIAIQDLLDKMIQEEYIIDTKMP